jgi:ferredoxin-type protein NapF
MEQLDNPARRRLFKGKMNRQNEIRLPWVVSEAVFVKNCTQCQDCLSVCETQIIVKDELGYPMVDFSKGECTDCKKCINICNEPLFKTASQIQAEKPWPIQFEIAKSCLALNDVYCQSCRDVCEPSAIKFSYNTSSIPSPNLHIDDCTQCGACVEVCPQNAIKHHFIKECR